MAFNGKYVLEKRENYEEFAAASAATPEQIARGKTATCTTEIAQNGNEFTVKRTFPNQTTTNKFTLGTPAELTLVEGKNAKATASLDGGKLVMTGENFTVVCELVGNQLKETLTLKGKTMIRWSNKA